MEKITFTYTKPGEEGKERLIRRPTYLKESYNSFKTLDNDKVNYLKGIDLDEENLTEEEIKAYDEVIDDYFELALPTLEEFLSENGLDPSRVTHKTFKKDQITNLNS